MRIFFCSLMVGLFLCVGSVTAAEAHEGCEDAPIQVELTEQQQQELAALSQSIHEQKKEMIDKYVEFGVFTEEKGNKIISMFDKHQEKLEENGYIPTWGKCKKGHKGDQDKTS
ncbi:YckD family protein [Desertibacillus haloalkaliphilus]|uniref:YckD family protein n=1 Tax=Desertibacillus haloalkaliphilus TaxID=1328930 RepID=UPI001C25781A|nr:YckD family protein [Desertibacillus haloalkaliphilus]MBU8907572.1 YckD family protein [Desertibacillus haloalkaliphilus]